MADPSIEDVEALLNDLSMPQQQFGGGYAGGYGGGYGMGTAVAGGMQPNYGVSANLLSDVDNLLSDIAVDQTTGIESDLDNLLSGNVDPYAMNYGMYGPGGMALQQQQMAGVGGMALNGACAGPGMTTMAQFQQQLADSRGPAGRGRGFATHDPMGRQLIYDGPPCARCGQAVIGKVLNAMGKNYHAQCFNCTFCQKPFSDGRFLSHEDDPYCEQCYTNLMATRCATCQMPITETAIHASGRVYHPNHFVCSGCGTNLRGQEYKDGEYGEPYCVECAKSRARLVNPDPHTCSKCKLPIYGEYITIKGQRMHPEHYTCDMCGCGFQGGNCHERDGKYYCLDCFRKLMKPVCTACKKPIPGRSITAMGRVWHPEHFVCAQCHQPFADGRFFEVEGRPFCELHYKQLYADRCHKCDKAIIGVATKGCGKSWHESCFVCQGCEKPFPTMQFWAWEDKPYCTKCFDGLPEKIRHKILKKQRSERTTTECRDRLERMEKSKEAKKIAKKKKKIEEEKRAAREAARQKAIERQTH